MSSNTNITIPPKSSLMEKAFSPLMQALYSFGLGLVGIVVTKLLSPETYYQFLFAFVGIVFYCLINAAVSIFRDSFVRYTMVSWWISIGLTIVLLLVARFISGVSIKVHPEFIQMLISLAIFYIVLSLAVRGIRAILNFIDNEKR